MGAFVPTIKNKGRPPKQASLNASSGRPGALSGFPRLVLDAKVCAQRQSVTGDGDAEFRVLPSSGRFVRADGSFSLCL